MKNSKNQKPVKSNKSLGARINRYKGFYIMFLPVLVFAIIFCYLPMLGIRYAFTNYNGIKAPTFTAFANFKRMFEMPGFWSAFTNTLQISIIKLVLTTFFAVVVSIFLNEIFNLRFKKVVQTIIYIPHFLSWVVTASLFSLILAPTAQSIWNLSAIPLDQCIPLIDSQTATLKDNLVPYAGFLSQSEMGEIPDYIIMRRSLFEEMGIASYKQVFETDNYLVLRKEDERFRFDIPTFSYTVEGMTGDNWITGEDAVLHLVSSDALDKIIIYVNYLPGTKLAIVDDTSNEEVFDLEECSGVIEYIVEGEDQKDVELRLYGEVTQKPMIVQPGSPDSRDLCASIKNVLIECK